MTVTNIPAPTNADGRYYWFGNASGVTGGQINFVGDPSYLTGSMALTWSILVRSGDGSYPIITYSTDGGTTLHSTQVGSEGTPQEVINESGEITVSLASATGIIVNVTSGGGSVIAGAVQWELAIAITRNVNESLTWDTPNPFNPLNYNAEIMDEVVPTQTLAQLRTDILIELGFASQSANPPPGMVLLINSWLIRGQQYLYRRYSQLHTRRMFRWKVNPGQRFYSLKDNDENVLGNFTMDPNKQIEWAGIQDTRNVWYPLVEGIPPQLYTMITKPWRPARYEIKQCIEIYPAPDQTYFLWMKAHFGLMAFAADTDSTTIDATLLFLHTLSIAKAHYGAADANNVQAMANAYRKELIAGTHGTKTYIPGTIAVPPAVRPTLIQYGDGQANG